ncbi:maleylpyruvate isomerase family mycothiol-dependent enzyme [Ktedonospora formicarum]|nr:maleylpyruvate isomerase family mycothiol-dependent enzyme [Ktedonospora formicarum]
MKAVEPIIVVDLFEPLLEHLLNLLLGLDEQDWKRETPCAGWSVKDIVLHLLGDDIGKLSGGRDKDTSSFLPPGPDLVSRINAQNQIWVEATRRMSPHLLCNLLEHTGQQIISYFKSLSLMEMNGVVSWAGPNRAPVWLDVAREYTERWHHQQHIREAVGQPELTEPTLFTPVLDTFVRALPWTFHVVEAAEGTTVALCVEGEAGKQWYLVRQEGKWSLFTECDFAPVTLVTMKQEIAWRLFTKGIAKERAMKEATIEGNKAYAEVLFQTVAIIA